ncbi:MAG: LysR family transcriptional regulator [Lachnospiraceae bacterium]|nr:LysR family transcriptional regulator [Lachnospiraceae bacterium]
MELKNIKTFIKVAELGSFSHAAADLGYAQSTISTQIQLLEDELGVQLFERNGKLIALSQPGESFLPFAYQIAKYESMAKEFFQTPQAPQGHLNIGIMESICASPYVSLFYRFMKKYPQITCRLQVATTYEAIDLLERGKLDLIFLLDHMTSRPGWTTARAISEQICFFCASDHPFAGRDFVTLGELLKERFLFVEKGCNYRHAFEQYLAQNGLEAPCCLEIGHTRFIIDAVISHLGISLLPRCTLLNDLANGTISLIHVQDYDLSMYIQVIYNTNRWAAPALRCLIEEAAAFPLQ